MVHSFRAAVARARRHGDLYFAALLPEDRILKAFEAARATWQGWVYTPANQAEYPQQKSQEPGCGFPIARIVVIFSLSVGTVLDVAIGKYRGKQTGENSLFRTLYDVLTEGDVVLADRYFSGWCDIALPLARGVDVVVRKHQLRPTDFRTGERLGKDDHLVCWSKPARPKWML